MSNFNIHAYLALLPEMSRIPQHRMQISYEADVLYISIDAPVEATHTDPTADVLICLRMSQRGYGHSTFGKMGYCAVT
jgi:hypothetical protein